VRLQRRVTAFKRFLPIAALILLGTAAVSGSLLYWRIHDTADEMGRVAAQMVNRHEQAHAEELAQSAAHLASIAPSAALAARMVEALGKAGVDEDVALFAPDGRQLAGGNVLEEIARAPIDEGSLAGGHVAVSRIQSGGLDGAALTAAVERERRELLDTLLVASALAVIASLLVTLLAGRMVASAFRSLVARMPRSRAAGTGAQAERIVSLTSALDGLRRELGAMQVTHRFLEQVLDQVQDGVVVCDGEGRVIEVNEAAATLLRRRQEELRGEDLHALVEPAIIDEAGKFIAEGRTRLRTSTGEALSVAFTTSPLPNDEGHPRYVLVVKNLTEEHRAQKRIRYLARYDTLTRVPNRMEFQHRLQQALARNRRNGRLAALFYVDIDHFKDVNDRLGHPTGDRALEITARRLVDVMDAGTLIGRLGGDEFAVVVESLPQGQDPRPAIAATARQLLDQITKEFHVEGQEIVMSASIGVALFPEDGDNVIDLIRNADAAMYHAKQNGGNTYGFYAQEMNADAVERLVLKSELRRAMERNEFQLLYQPKVDLRDGRVAGAEALLRWQHTKRGEIPPSVFIQLAEESTLIFEIGEWVLDRVCSDFASWQRHVPWPGRVAVNLSLRQLRQRDFIARVEGIFERHQLTPSCIELEITESTLADNGERTLRMLDRLYRLGLHLSIDDFGTGYSSLSSLQRFPIGTLKIDQSFVRDAGKRRDSNAIVAAIVGLGRSLGMDVVAEGVENRAQMALLRKLGCTYAQGHLFGEALGAADYLSLLRTQAAGNPVHSEILQAG
jgi:diguanylate cyclase (GGDEF)-like protein/PAS domain S-box-containing protein